MDEKKEFDSVNIFIEDPSGKLVKKVKVSVEELVICWMNYHFPQKKHIIKS